MDTDSHSLRSEEDCMVGGETHETLSSNSKKMVMTDTQKTSSMSKKSDAGAISVLQNSKGLMNVNFPKSDLRCATAPGKTHEIASTPQKRSSTIKEIETGIESAFGANGELSLKVNRDSECILSECEPFCSKTGQTSERIHSNPRDAKTRNLLGIVTRLQSTVVGKLKSQQSGDVNIDEEFNLQRNKSSNCINGSKKFDTDPGGQKKVVMTEIQNTSQVLEKCSSGEKLVENLMDDECSVNVKLSRSGPRCSTDGRKSTSKTEGTHQYLTGNNSMEIELTTYRNDIENVANKQGISECATNDEKMRQCSYDILKNISTIPPEQIEHLKDTNDTSHFRGEKWRRVSSSKIQLTTHFPHESRSKLRNPLSGKSFTSKTGSHWHERILHNKKSQLVCNVCGKSFNHKVSLNRHKWTVHNKECRFFCDVCGQSFTRKSNLRVHIRSVHNKEKPFICDLCRKSFTQRSSLYQHKRSVHNKERPIICDMCGKSFTRKSHFTEHKRAVHNKERPFICDMCGQSFTRKSHFTEHKRAVHNKERPFICDMCGKSFTRKSHFTEHKRAVHNKERPFICDTCGKSFSLNGYLSRHKRSVHNKARSFICDM